MSQDAAQAVRSLTEASNREDVDPLVALLHSAVEWHDRVYAVGIVRDGQLVRRESYSTRAEALRAVELRE